MRSNSLTLVSRPLVLMVSWNCWSCETGAAPIRPTGGLHVLRLDGVATSLGVDAVVGELARVEPDPHRVVERAEQRRVADAVDPLQHVDDVDRGIVGQIQRVVGAVRRIECQNLEQGRGDLLDRQALPADLVRQLRLGQVGPVLDVDRVDVGVGAELEGDRQRVAAVRAGGRLHVEHAVDAVDLLLDRLGHRLLDDVGTGAGIEARDLDLRRHDVRELRDAGWRRWRSCRPA